MSEAQVEIMDVVRCLGGYTFSSIDETRFQEGVEQAFQQSGLSFERELKLSAGDRVDFMVGGRIAVELKIDGSQSQVLRQIQRYAMHAQVAGVVLVTTRSKHIGMPKILNGKPVFVFWQSGLA